jgi:hypothetical protein
VALDFKLDIINIGCCEFGSLVHGIIAYPGGLLLSCNKIFKVLCELGRDMVILFEGVNLKWTS